MKKKYIIKGIGIALLIAWLIIRNVLQMNRVGRIFDNTFDHTFN